MLMQFFRNDFSFIINLVIYIIIKNNLIIIKLIDFLF